MGGGHDAAEVEAAAQLMYYGGHVADLLLLVALFTAWYRRTGRVPARVRTATSSSAPAAV
ncbi:MAG: hypothetical protein JHC71_20090 [Blastococcus sp.]|nr:hypothetical protein [Blastococcus sp.]